MAHCRFCHKEIFIRVCPSCKRAQRPSPYSQDPTTYLGDPFAAGQAVTVEGVPAIVVRVGRARPAGKNGEEAQEAPVWVRFQNGSLTAYPQYSVLPDPKRPPGTFVAPVQELPAAEGEAAPEKTAKR
jgi:hypothetical protein